MIGQFTFSDGTQRHTVTLSEELNWQCDDAKIVAYLEELSPVRPTEGLSNLAVGRHVLYQAAERMGGHLHIPTRTKNGQEPELV